MSQVKFIFNGENTIIQCNSNEKMKDICQKFKEKVNIDSNKNIFYSYNGQLGIKEESVFEEVANKGDKLRKKMSIIVFENNEQTKEKENDIIKSQNIICPICKENILMDIKDYKINLHDCKNNHKIENILLDEFEETQNIDRIQVTCDICKKYNKSISYNNIFYKCNSCNKNICPICKSNHDKSHVIINYDDKFYICDKHNESYISYCETCKLNICILCDKHKDHKRILFSDILPKKEKLIIKKNRVKEYIDKFNKDINVLINILNEVMNKMNTYYKINEDIINNYNNKLRNYETIYYLNQFLDNCIIQELNKVIYSKTMTDKFDNLFNIYNRMNIDEIKLIYDSKGKKELLLFGENFVERYKKYFKIVIDGKEHELKEKYTFGIFDKKKDRLELKLKGITNITDMSWMFYECSSLISLPDIYKMNTLNVTSINSMFNGCSSLPELPDISKWNISNVTDMSCLFYACSSLKSLPDLSKWDTSKVVNMSGIFSNCSSLISLPDISKWNTSNVIYMNDMFNSSSSLLSLPDISKWNTSDVQDMKYMFSGCSSLSSLPDIDKWDITNVSDMSDMFEDCKDSLNIPSKFKNQE